MNDATMNDIVDPSSGEVVPATITFQQAYQTYKNFVSDNRERNSKNSEKSLGSEAQQDIFRKSITDCIRNWSGWSDFVTQLIDEDIGYGYAAVGREDEFSWKPKLHRSDEAMFYVGCPQQAEKVKIWGLKQDYFVDEITAILQNIEAAQSAGWRVDNLIKKLNTAGKQFDDRADEANSRVYEDLIRENNLASSFTSSIRVVKAGHIFALNPAGGIDHYIFDRDDGTALFFRRARYSKMTECLTLFSAEIGDRTLHGSRGAGRALYNTHVSVEQARNLIQDALHLNGLLLMKRTTKVGAGVLETPGLTVMHPFAVVGEGFEVLEKVRFEIDADAFFALDRHATGLAEVQVGAFMPGQLANAQGGGQTRTASEVNYVASIDAQIRAGVLARFADQMFELIDQIQRRICNPETVEYAATVAEQIKNMGKVPIYDLDLFNQMTSLGIDQDFVYIELPEYIESDAFDCVLKMTNEGLTPSQIVILANSKSRSNVDDAIASQSGLIDNVIARYGADPIIDTVELKRRDISSKLGADAANRLMNVDLSPMSQVKQQRQQILELSSIMDGQEVPIDVSDDDMIHLKTIMDRMAPFLQAGQIPYELSQGFMTGALTHAQQHIQSATQKGVKPGDLKQFQDMIAQAMQMVQQPTLESAAMQAAQPAISGGAIPATELAVDTVNAAATPQTIIGSVANPTRPQPPRNL